MAAVFTQAEALHQMLIMFAAFGVIIFSFLGAMLSMMAALIGLHFGIQKFREYILDESFSIHGFYLRKVPFKGYHRFRSQKWNMKHMAG